MLRSNCPTCHSQKAYTKQLEKRVEDQQLTIAKLIKLAKNAIKNKADYLALGAFYYSKTKKVKYKASTNFLRKARKITKTPIVAIGGITSTNYKKLLLNKANFLAISGYIWKNKKLKPIDAIKNLK